MKEKTCLKAPVNAIPLAPKPAALSASEECVAAFFRDRFRLKLDDSQLPALYYLMVELHYEGGPLNDLPAVLIERRRNFEKAGARFGRPARKGTRK